MAKNTINIVLSEWIRSRNELTEAYGDVETGVETPLIARELSTTNSPVLLVFPVLSEVDECSELLPLWLSFINSTPSIHTLPETLSGQRFIPENEAARARVLNHALNATDESVFLTSVSGLLAPAPLPEELAATQFILQVGDETTISSLLSKIVDMDYDDELECGIPGEFSRRGGIVDIFSPAHDHPARIEFFGDTIESIRLFHAETQRTFKKVQKYEIISKSAMDESGDCRFIEYFAASRPTIVIVSPERCSEHLARFEDEQTVKRWETILADDKSTKILLLDSAETDSFRHATPTGVTRTANLLGDPDAEIAETDDFHSELRRQLAVERIKQWLDTGYTILVSAPFENSEELVREWCEENDITPDALAITSEHIPFGLTFPALKRVIITEKELLTASRTKTALPSPPTFAPEDDSSDSDKPLDSAEFADLEPGDYAVHFDHGICVYHGTCLLKDDGVECEMFKLEFADEVIAFVPLSQAHMLSKYIGSTKDLPTLTKKGGEQWLKGKLAAAKDIKEMAEELLRLQAMRLKRKGREFRGDTLWEHVFEESFPYEETPDQLTATEAVKADMASTRPMDRLICGDVGYGKTEIAMRAAFKAVMDECQVAVMVPTTILAQQHFISFTERFAAQPVTIEMLSRFKTHAEQKKTLAKLAEGKLDIVIGTHRLAQKDVSFANLGLVVIDEEQRFGVRHKERLKHFRATVDVLTMTATPIPRTLYMAMTGLRDLSAISTPPRERLPVRTFVCREDLKVAAQAIEEEIERGGQVFYLHNRVKTLEHRLQELSAVVPSARFAAAHGQMDEGELESVMTRFLGGEIDVLVCTTIIESGLDIPNANTIIIDRADRFGLSELYQLRGRVGRWHRQAYAYLFLPKKDILTGNARKRLAAIRRYTELGSGFRLALRDLEIRGAGNLLGAKQSGHINTIGFDLYCKLLRSAVAEESGKPAEFAPATTVVLDFVVYAENAPKGRMPATIPASYIPSERTRLGFFKRLGNAMDEKTIETLIEELNDRFGAPPECVLNYINITTLRILTTKTGYRKLVVRDGVVELSSGASIYKINGEKPVLSAKTASAKLAELLKVTQASRLSK